MTILIFMFFILVSTLNCTTCLNIGDLYEQPCKVSACRPGYDRCSEITFDATINDIEYKEARHKTCYSSDICERPLKQCVLIHRTLSGLGYSDNQVQIINCNLKCSPRDKFNSSNRLQSSNWTAAVLVTHVLLVFINPLRIFNR